MGWPETLHPLALASLVLGLQVFTIKGVDFFDLLSSMSGFFRNKDQMPGASGSCL
jgi:hypothetical protein